MARKTIDIGVVGNDGTGDSIRDSFRKVNDNFRELYSSLGLGERLKFTGLEDAPSTYVGQNDATTGNTPVVTVNNTESGLQFKKLVPGSGVSIDFTTNPNQITIGYAFAYLEITRQDIHIKNLIASTLQLSRMCNNLSQCVTGLASQE